MDTSQKPEQKKEHKKINISRVLIERFKVFAAVIAIASVAFGYYGIISPLRKEFSRKVGQDIERIQQEKSTKETELKRLTASLKNFEVVKSQNIGVLQEILRPADEKEGMLFILNAVAQQFGVYIKTFKLEEDISLNAYFDSPGRAPLPIVVVPASVTLAGKNLSYTAIKKILEGFQTKYGIFNIRSLDLTDLGKQASAIGSGEGESELKLKVDMFFVDDAPLSVDSAPLANKPSKTKE